MKQITYPEFLGKYKIREKIGQGGYGQVFKAYETVIKQHRAYKKIVLHKDEDLRNFQTEISFQNKLAHPLVMKIFEFYFNITNPKYQARQVEIGIISELGNTSLLNLIRSKNNEYPIEEVINFAFHFIKLFAYFQDLKIVHRDIKPQNFVQTGPGLQCKLIDFGLCTYVENICGTAGSFPYMSPNMKKMHTNKELAGRIRTNPYKDDVYSFGLTLYELIVKQPLNPKGIEPAFKYSSNVYYKTQNQKLAQIVQMMLEYEEKSRPDFNQLYRIFKQKFEFIEEDPVNEIDGYSEKDLAQMSLHERHEVMRRRSYLEQEMRDFERTERRLEENRDFRNSNRFDQKEQRDYFNGNFESKRVCYVDKEMEEEREKRKKRHFGNEKVILKEEPTNYTRNQNYENERLPVNRKYEQNYESINYENQRQYEGEINENEMERTIQIDNHCYGDRCPNNFPEKHQNYEYQNQNKKDLDIDTPATYFSGQMVTKVEQSPQDISIDQPIQTNQTNQADQKNIAQEIPAVVQKPPTQYWKLPHGIGVNAILISKEFIFCGCSDGNFRVIVMNNTKRKNIYKIVGPQHSHEGSPIVAISKASNGNIWTASQNGKLIRWYRSRIFAQMSKDYNYIQNEEQIENLQNPYEVKEGLLKLIDHDSNSLAQSFEPKSGVTALYCYNEQRYCIGFSDGSAYICWDNQPFSIEMHSKPITSFQKIDDEILISSLDGTISSTDMANKFSSNEKVTSPYPISGFYAKQNQKNLQILITTVDGRGYFVNTEGRQYLISDQQEVSEIKIAASFFVDLTRVFRLAEDGSVFDNSEKRYICNSSQSWSCIDSDQKTCLVIGSRQGEVAMFEFEKE